MTRARNRRWWMLLAPVMLFLLSLTPYAVQASATGCRPGGKGYFCFNVDGSGKYVRAVVFERSRVGTIKNPDVTVQVKNSQGNVVWQATRTESKSWKLARTIKLNVDNRFSDDAAQVCGQWREEGYFSEICHQIK